MRFLLRIPFFRERKNQQISLAVGTVVFVVVLVLFGLRPAIEGALLANKLYGEAQTTDKVLGEKLVAIEAARTLIKNQTENEPLIDQALPGGPKQISFFNTVSLLAAQLKLSLEGLDTSGKVTTLVPTSTGEAQAKIKGLNVIAFTVNVSGEYVTIANFVSKLEQLPRIARIQNVVLTIDRGKLVQDGNVGVTPLNATIQAEFYYYAEE